MNPDPASSPRETPPGRMVMTVESEGEAIIVALSGRIDATATGPLCDRLVALIADGWRQMVIELGPDAELTRPGLRGFVVAAKLLQARRGRLRLCGATTEAEAFALRESFRHLLRFDADRATALSRIAAPDPARIPRATLHIFRKDL